MSERLDNKLIIYTDGGSKGNPGPAGAGVVITTPKLEEKHQILKTYAKFLGIATNNQAEYQAVILALEKAKALKAEEVDIFLDSELVASQLNMQYKIKDKNLGPFFIKIWNLRQSFKKVTFNYIPREKNRLADKLVEKVIKNFS